MKRRDFIHALTVGLPVAAFASRAWGLSDEGSLPPVRAITKGPKFHWFGYYDKLEFDSTSRYVLCNEVGFEGRTPTPSDAIRFGMIDTQDNDRWIDLGENHAWSWQQGSMLQWLPGSKTEVIWNDVEGDRFVSRILDVRTRKKRTLAGPIYGISPDAKWAVSPDFSRLHDHRPGYGYAGIPDKNRESAAPEESGIWKMDLASGMRELLIPFAAMLKIPYQKGGLESANHWFNHLLVSPDGSRFIFLHRWRDKSRSSGSFETRMFTSDPNGKDLYVLDPYGKTSHFIWRDPKHVLAWAWHPSRGDKFYLYEDRTDRVEVVGPDVMTVNGHCTYLPGNKWILNDTYPDKQHLQNPYLFEVATGKRHPLGHFLAPSQYRDEFRCDNHPRFSPDGTKVVIDAAHAGNGRQLYLIDISSIVS